MLHEEITKYRELSGDTNPHTPISRIGGYLDGYERALEQQTCEDAVSREAVLGLFAQNADTVRPYSKTWEEVKNLPSVNPQRTGHWIKYGKLYQCSECKELSCCQGKFCNECGAKMVESQESEVQDAVSD